MTRLDLALFRERADEFAGAVRATPEVAPFCSGPVWQLAAHDALHQREETTPSLIVEEEGTWLAFVRTNRSVFGPMEAAWGFGCPLVGEPSAAVALLRKAAASLLFRPVGFLITGIRSEGALYRELRGMEDEFLRFEEFETTDCMTIDLSEGVDAWRERRSKKFRRTIRGAGIPHDIAIEDGRDLDCDEVFDRILAIQRSSHKWESGTDIFLMDEYETFYRMLWTRLRERGEGRLLFARHGRFDVAYILGGVSGDGYRGFQMSYRESVRSLGLGNALQLENMRRVADEGIARYDLGMHAAYKERWADEWEEYTGVFVVFG